MLLFVTYTENNQPKKAQINEERYNALKLNPAVSDLVLYPTELIMENNYRTIVSGTGSNRRILNG